MFFRKYKRRIEELEKELERVKDRTKELGDENDRTERILKHSKPGEITYDTYIYADCYCNHWCCSYTLYIYKDFQEYKFNNFAPCDINFCSIDFEQGELSNIIFAHITCEHITDLQKQKITCVLNLKDLSFCKIGEEDIE